MYYGTPVFFLVLLAITVEVIASVGLSVLWGIFAATLLVTTVVAVVRTIPRKER
jgi:hypothetical protein